jgi:hypothetical protein
VTLQNNVKVEKMQTKTKKPLSNPIAHIAKYNEAILKVFFDK